MGRFHQFLTELSACDMIMAFHVLLIFHVILCKLIFYKMCIIMDYGNYLVTIY